MLIELAKTLIDEMKFKEALETIDKYIETDENNSEAFIVKGNTLVYLNKFFEAIECYEKAMELNPNSPDSYCNIANVYDEKFQDGDKAIEYYDKALSLDNQSTDYITWNKGICLMRMGRLKEGWVLYDHRKLLRKGYERHLKYKQPMWRGEDLKGKTIFVYWEQAFGDNIQFARYLPELEKLGARVIFSCRNKLARLFRSLSPTIEFIDENAVPENFDYHCALLSLPIGFNITMDNIPNKKYLHAETEKVEYWNNILNKEDSEKIKIGIVYRGSRVKRSIDINYFYLLLNEKVRLISLQKETESISGIETYEIDTEEDAFIDTAAIIENLDLVIAVDTGIAHLAGALGKPVWLILKEIADWRWFIDKQDSPWYKTMKIFRTKDYEGVPEVMGNVFARIRTELEAFVENKIEDCKKYFDFHVEGKFEEAIEGYRKVLELNPEHYDANHLLAVALSQLNFHDTALIYIEKALKIKPQDIDALANYGLILEKLGKFNEALKVYDAVLAKQPNRYVTWNNRGTTLRKLNRYNDAIYSYKKSISIEPKYYEAYSNLGFTYDGLSRFDEALEAYEMGMKVAPPDNIGLLWNKGVCHLHMGDYKTGWEAYELRTQFLEVFKTYNRNSYTKPRLTNADQIKGKTIFVYWEQGLGDIIMFSRYICTLYEYGAAHVVFSVPYYLMRLYSTMPVPVEIVKEDHVPEHYDYHCPLASLPMVFGTRHDTIPNLMIPYLNAEGPLVEEWAKALGKEGFKIGIVWQASNSDRSVDLNMFYDISQIPGVRLISLQKFDNKDPINRLNIPENMLVESYVFDDEAAFIDTAAIIKNLDLLITVDTSIVHLTGAMGCPIWVAVKEISEWRWGPITTSQKTTKWYPSVRLFKQKLGSSLYTVFDEIKEALIEEMNSRKTKPTSIPLVPVSWGELVDKITILEIKSERIKNENALKNVNYELDLLLKIEGLNAVNFDEYKERLKIVNAELWDVLQKQREMEQVKNWDQFIILSISVYKLNDERAELKRKINDLFDSPILEEKYYPK